MTIFAYARVSTDGQSVDAQVKALRAAGAEKVFKETASGASSDRAQLRRAIAALGKGDVLEVISRFVIFCTVSWTNQELRLSLR